MKNLGLIGGVLVVGLSVAALASQAPSADAPEIKSLADADAAIHALTLRVAALEARLEAGDSVPSAPAPSPGAAVMKIESIETVQPTDDAKREAKAIQIDADNLDRHAAALDANAAGITIDSGPQVTDSARSSARKQLNSLRNEAGEARRSAKAKRKEADAMLAPRQIIRGWTGKKSVEARTERDLSSQLKGIVVGSYVTADWTLVDMDETTATVMIKSIRNVAAPAGFVERPAGTR